MPTLPRTTSEIFNELVANVQGNDQLTELTLSNADDYQTYITTLINNPSQVDIMGHFIYLAARVQQTQEENRYQYELSLEESESQSVFATPEWWSQKLLEFQYGDDLIITTTSDNKRRLTYQTIDPSKQIVKRASVTPDGLGGSIFKVAGEDDNNNLVALSNTELIALRKFVSDQTPAGANIDIRTKNSDLARYYITIYYDPLFNLEDDGAIEGIQTQVENAVNNYHLQLDFNGAVDLVDLQDAIQAVPGLESIAFNAMEAKERGGEYVAFNPFYVTSAGYIEIDISFPLSDTITYEAVINGL